MKEVLPNSKLNNKKCLGRIYYTMEIHKENSVTHLSSLMFFLVWNLTKLDF